MEVLAVTKRLQKLVKRLQKRGGFVTSSRVHEKWWKTFFDETLATYCVILRILVVWKSKELFMFCNVNINFTFASPKNEL